MEPQKISFGFSKLTKKTNIISKKLEPIEKKIDFIDCLEGQSIKIKDAVEEITGPLIIPMNDSSKTLIDRIKEAKKKIVVNETTEIVDDRPDSELTLDELAARQLLRESKNIQETNASTILTLPTPDKFVAEGKEEPTLDDYENIPISQYGMAMLRGMGWTENKGIGKSEKIIKTVQPELRPKGMGLGASKMINSAKPEASVDRNGKELSLVKGAYAKIIAGHHKSNYCEILGLDDESGRVIVQTALGKQTLTLNEFLIVPVTKEEYVKSSKVINNEKYDEYKEISDNKLKQARNNLNNDVRPEKENYNRSVLNNSGENEVKNVEETKEKKSKKKHKKSKKHKKNRSRSKSRDNKERRKKDEKRDRSYTNTSSDEHDIKSKSRVRKYDSDDSEDNYRKSRNRNRHDNNSYQKIKDKRYSKDRRRYRDSS